MNWNEPHTGDYDEVFLLLESGKIIHVPTHRVIEKVVGWMTVDQYIQQTKALAQPGAFVGKWEAQKPDEYDFMDFIIFGDNEYYCNLSAALEVVERMRK